MNGIFALRRQAARNALDIAVQNIVMNNASLTICVSDMQLSLIVIGAYSKRGQQEFKW